MIKVFYGENRVKAREEIQKFLGENYEVVEGADLGVKDLPNIFWGTSLFSEERAVLVRDILANKEVAGEIKKYLDSPHKVAILEMKVDKRSNAYKDLQGQVEFLEFVLPQKKNAGLVFEIYRVAKKDGVKAVKMLDEIKEEQEPLMFLGLMVSQAVRDYAARPRAKEKRALLELSKLDMQLKRESTLQPWVLISSFLLRLGA
ncbi:hypothetical protein IJH01_02900 [Candidatus Saccharibacteria bacterium]|nr:hypothetical protein [Candidatus Saccharibacteria bacterium]